MAERPAPDRLVQEVKKYYGLKPKTLIIIEGN